MQITVLCKVVDNFGDIGVVYRLCKQLLFIQTDLTINLVVDDLSSFNKINSLVNPSKSFQKIDRLLIYSWNDEKLCHKDFSENDGEKLSVILECFQCGRPDWMEKILFEEKLNRICHIVMIDYLTAEKYAEDFHCLKSLTRSAKVQKVNFMPGFTNKTGGLIIDELWKKTDYNPNGPYLIFTYEKNWDGFVRALGEKILNDDVTGNDESRDAKKILLAPGRGKKSFLEAYTRFIKSLPVGESLLQKLTLSADESLPAGDSLSEKSSIPAAGDSSYNSSLSGLLTQLDFMNQEDWDKMMKTCSVLFIRGEESLSRACLSGIPFVWHAYPQSEEYQIVKVNALLQRIKEYFTKEDFTIIKNLWLDFNKPESELNQDEFFEHTHAFLENTTRMQKGFSSFADDLRKNGDLASNLMTFLKKNAIL